MATRTRLALFAGLTLAVVSCGGGDDDATSNATEESAQPSETEPSPQNEGDSAEVATSDVTEPAAAPDSGGGGDAGTGTIEIGDLRHDLTITRCVTLAGAIAADAVSVSEPDNIDVSFSFSPEDWKERDASEGWTETGTVRLDSDDPYQQWESGAGSFEGFNLPAGTTATDFDITALDISDDGQSARGEGIFVEINALLGGGDAAPTPGSFEFTCPQT